MQQIETDDIILDSSYTCLLHCITEMAVTYVRFRNCSSISKWNESPKVSHYRIRMEVGASAAAVACNTVGLALAAFLSGVVFSSTACCRAYLLWIRRCSRPAAGIHLYFTSAHPTYAVFYCIHASVRVLFCRHVFVIMIQPLATTLGCCWGCWLLLLLVAGSIDLQPSSSCCSGTVQLWD